MKLGVIQKVGVYTSPYSVMTDGIPYEATQAGAETTYPEYQLKIRQMQAPNQGGTPKR